MNKYIILVCITFISYQLDAQVGVYTQNPKGILHIDALANNPSTGNPSAAQEKDDVAFSTDANSIAKMTIGGVPRSNSAQLQLTSANKAFLPNRVALTSTADITTVPSPKNGMFIYNTSIAGSGTTAVVKGPYAYYNNQWNKLQYDVPFNSFKKNTLQTSITTPLVDGSQAGKATVTANYGTFTFDQAGAYAFMFRIYMTNGSTTATTIPTREVLYIWLYSGATLLDVAELNPTLFADSQGKAATYSVVLSASSLAKGQAITIKYSTFTATPRVVLPAGVNNTVVYWRVEQ